MRKILVNHTSQHTRAVVMEDGEIISYYSSSDFEPQLIGNIYKGRVQNVLPGMQAAFVDIGTDRNAFLQFGKKKKNFRLDETLLIQIEKEAVGTKGPRATLLLSIPGQKLVLLPDIKSIGISHQIKADERKRLFETIQEIRPESFGIIVRTAAEHCPKEILIDEINRLVEKWTHISERAKKKSAPSLIYSENDILTRMIRDELCNEVDEILIDSFKMYVRAVALVKEISPEFKSRISHYEGEESIFEDFHIEDEIAKLTAREIELPSGGSIVIDRTEAMTVIDVNTSRFVGNDNLSETVFETNLEAASAIVKQIRLRDISGIIIVDFIDMNKTEQKHQLMTFLKELATRDRRRMRIVDMTPLGLVEITRKNN